MRLGGSVAWPVKPDRIVERTEFLTFDDGRPRVYLPGQLARAFPGSTESRSGHPRDNGASSTSAASSMASPSTPASPPSAPATIGTTTWCASPVTGSHAAGPTPRS